MNNNNYITRGCKQTPKSYSKSNSAFCKGYCKLDEYNWLGNFDLPKNSQQENFVEVRFKNSRKDIFKKPANLELVIGDIVAVETATAGHDIGIVTLTGALVLLQIKKKNIKCNSRDIKKVYRRAKSCDIEKWINVIDQEMPTLFKTRKMANELNLNMKVSDVEYQGDKTKATFYYTADERVDYRELIKILSEKLLVRVEMKQIGMRMEASRLGGIGSCGRELCCSSWLTDFKSVSVNSARCQQFMLNPQKIAGQCSKLKCCLNYEYDCYFDALKEFPDTEIILKTKKGDAIHQKTDVHKKIMWYAYTNNINTLIPINLDKVKEVIALNKKNVIPEQLDAIEEKKEKDIDFENAVGQGSLTRFDKENSKNSSHKFQFANSKERKLQE